MTEFDYDVAVIGCGPAGATLARLLKPEFRTVVIDKKCGGEGGFKKPCGGLLAADAQRALSRFNLTLPKDILVDPQIFSVKTMDLKTGLVRYYQRFYINMDRRKFDSWLSSIIPSHVSRIFGVCLDVKRVGGGFAVTYKDADGSKTVMTSRYLVGADGASSVSRNALFAERKPRYYVAIQQWFENGSANPFYSCVFDPETSDACSWSISKDAFFVFGGAFAPKNCRASFEKQKGKLASFGFTFGEPVKTEACLVLRPGRPRDFCCGANGAFFLGEAAGFISPSSFEGMSWAFESAYLLARTLNSSAEMSPQSLGVRYARLTLPLRLRLIAKRLKCPFMYNPFLRKLVMKSGLKSIRVISEE